MTARKFFYNNYIEIYLSSSTIKSESTSKNRSKKDLREVNLREHRSNGRNPIFSRDLVKFISSKIFSTRDAGSPPRAHLPPGDEVSFSFFLFLFSLLSVSVPFAVTRQKLVACLAKCSPVPCPWFF